MRGRRQRHAGSDDFNRADGQLGPNWADISDGGLAISGQQVTGTAASGVSGDIRTAETYQSDQFSQVTLTSTQLTGSQWIGPAVRMQNGGQNAYVGIYNWNNGSPNVMLFERNAGNWTQLGSTYNSGPLAAGTTLKLMVTGSTLALMVNGTERVAVGDTTLSGGAPGIMANGTAQADNWSGGARGLRDALPEHRRGGISSYDIISANDSDGPHVLRVLQPTNPAAGVAHNFLFVLPVEPETGSQFGDAISLPAEPGRAGPVQPDHHRARVRHRSLVRGQFHRPERAVRDVHDAGTGALGTAEPVDHRDTSRTG